MKRSVIIIEGRSNMIVRGLIRPWRILISLNRCSFNMISLVKR